MFDPLLTTNTRSGSQAVHVGSLLTQTPLSGPQTMHVGPSAEILSLARKRCIFAPLLTQHPLSSSQTVHFRPSMRKYGAFRLLC